MGVLLEAPIRNMEPIIHMRHTLELEQAASGLLDELRGISLVEDNEDNTYIASVDNIGKTDIYSGLFSQ